MSGGFFQYDQYKLNEIADQIERVIERNGVKLTLQEFRDRNGSWLSNLEDWYDKYPEDAIPYNYSPEVVERFKEGLRVLKEAYVYTHEIDWLLSGDTGEESFLTRLKQALNEI